MTESDAKGPKLIDLSEPGQVIYPPQSQRFKSQVVELPPGKNVGLHSTHHREELVVILEGEGELRLPESEPNMLPLSSGKATYVPPETPHDIYNTGEAPLRYIYIVAMLD